MCVVVGVPGKGRRPGRSGPLTLSVRIVGLPGKRPLFSMVRGPGAWTLTGLIVCADRLGTTVPAMASEGQAEVAVERVVVTAGRGKPLWSSTSIVSGGTGGEKEGPCGLSQPTAHNCATSSAVATPSVGHGEVECPSNAHDRRGHRGILPIPGHVRHT